MTKGIGLDVEVQVIKIICGKLRDRYGFVEPLGGH
jgi:hypothetical protein